MLGPGARPYPPGTVDFIAVYLIAEDTWYIIPSKVIRGHSTLHFTPGGRRQKYKKYEEAWELLKKVEATFEGFKVSRFESFKVSR